MQRSATERIQDMLDEARFTQGAMMGMTRESFLSDELRKRAITRSLGIIGEVARYIPEETRVLSPGIPWPQITGMRHRIVHDYMGTNYGVVWTTATQDIPPLVS